MIPVYFPFTYISENSIKSIGSVFKKIGIYNVTDKIISETIQQYVDNEVLHIVDPIGLDFKSLEISLNEYKQWWSINRGGDMALKNITMGDIPFYNETATSRIRSDIQGRTQKKIEIDPFLESMFFLRIAHEFDLQQDLIDSKLNEIKKLESNLYKELRGEDESISNINGTKEIEEKAEHEKMIAERISSWSMLPVNEIKNNIEKQPLLSEVYITDSLPAIDYIIEKTPSVKLVFSINLTPAIKMVREKENKDKVDIWQDKLLNCLTDLAKNDNLSLNDNGEISIENNTDIWKSIRNVPDIQNIGKPVSLKIYLDNKICPSVFFANLSGKDILSPLSLTTQTEIKNTVLVLIS